MTIICTDNFDRETVSDRIVATNVSEYYATLIAKLLNSHVGESSPDFYKAVPDDHNLYVFKP